LSKLPKRKKKAKSKQVSDAQDKPELFIALIGAVGTDLRLVSQIVARELQAVQYEAVEIRVSGLLHEFKKYSYLEKSRSKPEHERIEDFMDAGDKFRRAAKRGDALTFLTVGKIRGVRRSIKSDPKKIGRAYLINSLKHPDEVEKLRSVYGSSFFAISVYESRDRREKALCEAIAKSSKKYDTKQFEAAANDLIDRDQKDPGDDLGQNVRDAFPNGDLFINVNDPSKVEEQIRRIVRILFGYPFSSPTVDEFVMFHAKSAALRSVDLSRQVGAVIATENGEILATGCNDVPHAGGGVIWENQISQINKDNRDFVVGYDSSVRMSHELIAEVFKKMADAGWLSNKYKKIDPYVLAQEALATGKPPLLRGSRAASVIEFGRIVHGEMAAVCDAALRGISVKDQTLYCTTFPCHMCARHIIASGIRRVVYIEPYPKSLAKQLYPESISIDFDLSNDGAIVSFEPFNGIAPRRYFEFFQSSGPKKDRSGRAVDWEPRSSVPKMTPSTRYLDLEVGALEFLKDNKKSWGILA
jgi:deoxycytidylate deaminase